MITGAICAFALRSRQHCYNTMFGSLWGQENQNCNLSKRKSYQSQIIIQNQKYLLVHCHSVEY